MSGSEPQIEKKIGTSISFAAELLRQGKIVAFPTETYYGLGVDPDQDQAVQKLYQLKQRNSEKPLLLLIDREDLLEQVVEVIPTKFRILMKKFWPGPLTLIFPARKSVNKRITANSGTVGVRISPNPIANALVVEIGKPITATSANISGEKPATSAMDVYKMFGDQIDYILDGGNAKGELGSTIVAECQDRLVVLRCGQLEVDEELLSGL